MKTLKSILVTSLVLIATFALQAQDNNRDKQKNDVSYNAQSKSIIVPTGNGSKILIDGIFSKGEWTNATIFNIAKDYDIYLLANSENFFLGLKPSKQKGAFVCDIWITTNGKEIYRLHVSMKLGEGFTSFDNYDRKVYLKKTNDWEANIVKEVNESIYELNDGVEFKIKRNKFLTNRLKTRIEWRNLIDKMSYEYPSDANLKNADNWVELIYQQ